MRILFDSKDLRFKKPFGTLMPDQDCFLNLHIPASVHAAQAACVICHENGTHAQTVSMELSGEDGPYEIFSGSFCLAEPGLFFYYFVIDAPTGIFRLFKQGDDTNMEAGNLWQVSCIPGTFSVPQWALGASFYQIFPDRFYRSGTCDLTGKLQPYVLHENWNEEVFWQPTADGKVLNNDFFGGNFRGITEKLDYIASLGATILYLNPISKSFSSHRYDTGDYKTPDPMLGTLEEFTALCDAAHNRGMRVILDGVFSHTGSNSLYFNKNGAFPGKGAYQSPLSPYNKWYSFHRWPDSYQSWWNFDTLPTVNKTEPSFLEYIITGEDSVIAHWLRAGCDGFRLDVADELPNEFLSLLKARIRELKPDALLLGEVWEDASNKIAYGRRCRYFVDGTLDSVMNYPFRNAILSFLRGYDQGWGVRDTVMTIAENYPPQVLLCNMNHLGTHDTPRILTALVDDFEGPREQQAYRTLSSEQLALARQRLLLASVLQYTLPGSPSLYYGDEAGMQGYKDPFNRRTYPWGREDSGLLAHFRALGQLRRENAPLRLGDIRFFQAGEGKLGYTRSLDGKTLRICINRSGEHWELPSRKILFSQGISSSTPGWLTLQSMGFCIMEE